MDTFLADCLKRFLYYKELGDKTFDQLEESHFFIKPNTDSNSIAIIVQHLHGNMMSRWTNFLTEDGEKYWRKRDAEFEPIITQKEKVISLWNEGWNCLKETLHSLTAADLQKKITIRSEPLLVSDAILRQLAHYPYHVGQIVFLGVMIKDTQWQSLSIPKNSSKDFNEKMGHLKA